MDGGGRREEAKRIRGKMKEMTQNEKKREAWTTIARGKRAKTA